MVKGLFIPAAATAPVERWDYHQLEDYQAAVGGWIEAVDIPGFGPITMYVNENGIAERLEPNLRATFLWWFHSSRAWEHAALVGDVALVGYPDHAGNTTDVPDDVLELLTVTTPHVVSMKIEGAWYANRVVNRDYWEAIHWAMIKLSREPEIEDVDVVPADKADRLPLRPIPPLPTLGGN
jgi:hypothetical protein